MTLELILLEHHTIILAMSQQKNHWMESNLIQAKI